MKIWTVNIQTGPYQFAEIHVEAATMQEAWQKAMDMNQDAIVMAVYTFVSEATC